MASMKKYENISIQPVLHTQLIKTTFELPNENLSEAEMARNSTSYRIKRRVAHKVRFPLPVIKKPVVVPANPVKNESQPIHVNEQCLNNICSKTVGKNKKSKDKSAIVPSLPKTSRTPRDGVSAVENIKKRKDLVFDNVDEMSIKKRKKTIIPSNHIAEIPAEVDKKCE